MIDRDADLTQWDRRESVAHEDEDEAAGPRFTAAPLAAVPTAVTAHAEHPPPPVLRCVELTCMGPLGRRVSTTTTTVFLQQPQRIGDGSANLCLMLKEDTVLGRRIRHQSEMPVTLAPYPTPPVPFTTPNGGQSQLVCSGCRNLLLYPLGATSVCCAVCSAVTAVPPPGTEMAQLICGGCHTLLMFIRGATSVQCSCCHTVNLAMEANQVAHVNCGNCHMLLMYQYGARSVKCAVCNFVTSVGTLPSTEQKPSS
ncbi:hypothetical protein OPV22_014608 [Ensete ventricosum]|uniref:Zinc finger LSD1-type domain-containing protein n=1 Tax=Ensete ventricosum TaxID=4639 RepID=A0AAV8R8E5_ENSVE|nr:hypothetical protein OPV22_014608 [Ensete ventricosum]